MQVAQTHSSAILCDAKSAARALLLHRAVRPLLSIVFALVAFSAIAQDVYTPPVPIGILRDGKAHTAKRPIIFPDAQEVWTRTRTPHFDVISSATDDRTRAIAVGLETLGSAVTELAPVAHASRATVFVFSNRNESQPYFDLLLGRENSSATGMYVRHHDGGTMFIDGSRARRIERTALHELVHDLLRQNDLAPPLWLEEGLAEYYGNADVQQDRVVAGLAIPEHQALLRRKVPMSANELFAVTIESDAAAAPAFYAQSWAAVSWLMRSGADRFWPFLTDVSRGTSVDDALAKHYGKSAKDIRFTDSPKRVVLPAPQSSDTPVASPFDRADVLYELGRFLSHVDGSEQDADRHFHEALKVNPKHARSLAALGDYEAAVAADPNDAEVQLTFAESLLGNAIGDFAGVFEPQPGDAERFRRARTHAEHALSIHGDEGRARADLGATYLAETDVTEGIAQLERARELAPQRSDVALNLYAMLLRKGERAKADALFAAELAHPRDKQVAFAARNVLLLSETARANALAQSGKLDEAAGVVRALAAETLDDDARRDLEQQAAELENTAAVNRHIQRYNEAIALSNTGKVKDALKILDALLAEATDPAVLRDAKRLHSELHKRK